MTTKPSKKERDRKQDMRDAAILNTIKQSLNAYAENIILPCILSKKAATTSDATPSDFRCTCMISEDDDLPLCQRRKRNCRFRTIATKERTLYATNAPRAWARRQAKHQVEEMIDNATSDELPTLLRMLLSNR